MNVRPEEYTETLRVAYLISQYPATSHAFIEREIAGLRANGVDVQTYSIQPVDLLQLSAHGREEAHRTFGVLGRPILYYIRVLGGFIVSHPKTAIRGAREAIMYGRKARRKTVWQIFYLAEAIVLLQRLRADGITAIHAHHANNAADVARLAVDLGNDIAKPIDQRWQWSLSIHGPTELVDPSGHGLAGKLISASAVACISEYCRDTLRMLIEPTHWRKLYIVRMTVDCDRFAPTIRNRDVSAGNVRILFVGRLVQEKGVKDLIYALRSVREQGRECTVRIIGDGPEKQGVEELVALLGLTDIVELKGAIGQDDIVEHYKWADIFCLPSYAEGLPVVLMEAMSTELPVVTTRIAAVSELVADGISGRLVTPGSTTELSSALAGLISNPQLRREMGRSGRKRVVEEFSSELNSPRLIKILENARAGN